MHSPRHRQITIVDGMILVAVVAVGLWLSAMNFIPWFRAMLSIPPDVWAGNPVWLAWHWGSLLARHTQPMVAVLTLGVLFARLSHPHPALRRLVRQPGFAACVAGTLAVLVTGGLNVATTNHGFVVGHQFQGYVWVALFPQGFEPGVAVAACWLLLALGGRWHPEPSWIDRVGRGLGIYWMTMILITATAAKP